MVMEPAVKASFMVINGWRPFLAIKWSQMINEAPITLSASGLTPITLATSGLPQITLATSGLPQFR